jgi:AsmA protein
MKRIAWILAAVVLAAVALFALVLAMVPRDALKAHIGEQIASWTGRDVSLRSEPEIGFFPLSVTLNDVHVGGPVGMQDAEIISMDRLTGTIRLLPLVIGRIEVGSYSMTRPLARLVRDQEGHRNWDFDSGAAALQLAFAGDVPLGAFTLEGGTIILEDRQSGDTERLDSVNLGIDWPSVRQPLSIEGTGIWRGEQVVVSGNAAAPFSFINGGATPLDARIDAAPITAIFSGQADDYPKPKLTGPLKLSTPSLRRLASWLGSPISPGSTLGPASGFGTAAVDTNGLSVEDAEFALDGNGASGALKIAITPKLDVTGTLAFGVLDLSPYFAGLSAAISTSDDWRDVSLPTDWFDDMNADIRLSASSVQLGDVTASNAAASVSMRDRRLEIGLARADFSGGSLTGDLAVTNNGQQSEAAIEAQLRANEIVFALPPAVTGLPQAISGNTSVLIDVTTKGRDLGSLVAELSGTARVNVEDGSVPLFGVADVAAAAGGPRNPFPAEGLAAVAVESASAGFSLSAGLGMLERGNVVTQSYSADVQGWIGLLDGTLGLNGAISMGPPKPPSASATTALGASPEAASAAFTIAGTLTKPEAHLQAPPQ